MSITTRIRAYTGKLENVLKLSSRLMSSSEGTNGKHEPSKDPSADDLLEEGTDSQVEDEIESLRNKSRLGPSAYKRMYKIPPSLTEDEKHVFSLSRLRKIYGNYGSVSGVNVGLLWPSKEEMLLMKERERVEFPDNIPQMLANAKRKQEEEADKMRKRQEDLAKNVAKLEDWKNEVKNRFYTQQRMAQEAKEKKEKMIEEVRQMFGFRIDPKDERFKEAIAKKEEEEKRAAKAAKKLKKQQKIIENIKRLSEKGSDQLEGDKTSNKES